MPTITSHKPVFGRWAPVLTCILWCSAIAGWIWFLPIAHTHPSSNGRGGFDSFFGMLLFTVILFVAGLIILAAAAFSYAIRIRRYSDEQKAFAASKPVPPSRS